jgi:dTMP kinase
MLIAIEGIDGSGKGTQAKRLVETLRGEGRSAALLGFPRYDDTFFGARVGDFLNGRFGPLAEVHPFLASLLFAGDRLESRETLQRAIAEHEYVVCDRYVSSNIAHQAAKRMGEERAELRRWIERVEYDLHSLPRADRVVLLDLPAEAARKLVAKKARRTYTENEADLQESDTAYQESVRRMYLELCEGDPIWRRVTVAEGDSPRSVEEISQDVRAACRA